MRHLYISDCVCVCVLILLWKMEIERGRGGGGEVNFARSRVYRDAYCT